MALPRNPWRWFAATLAVLTCAGTPPGASANEIINGSFETGPPPGAVMNLPNASTAVTGWLVSRGNVDYVGNEWLAEDGACSMALNGTMAGGVSQTFSSYAGAQYGVTFYLSGDPFTTPVLKHLHVTAADTAADFTFDVSQAWHWDMKWALRTMSFTANSNTTTIEFYSLDTGDYGPAIDNVVVQVLSSLDVRNNAAEFALAPVRPNPSSGPPRIDYSVARPAGVRVSVFDLAGREIAVLADGPHGPGHYSLIWGGGGKQGRATPGLYFIRLRAEGRSLIRRVTLVP